MTMYERKVDILKKKTRADVIKHLMKMANRLSTRYSYRLNKQMWRLCSDWNSLNPKDEIFMCESEDGDGRDCFCIEDDYWYYGE